MMLSFGAFLQEMFVLYGISMLGFLARKKGIFNKDTNKALTGLILYITLPALILFSFNIPFSKAMISEFFWLIFLSILFLAFAYLLARWMGNRAMLPAKQKSVIKGLVIFGNQGFIGYGVVYILLGDNGVVYLTVFNICYIILLWTYGIYLFSKSVDTVHWRYIFFNPGIVSTLTGILIFVLPVRLPELLSRGLEMVGNMTIPLSMLLIGSFIAKVDKEDFFRLFKNVYIWKAAFVRLIVVSLLFLPITLLPVPDEILLLAAIASGMPAAPTISLYAEKYGADAVFASFGVLITTFLCIFTIPFIYLLISIL